MDGFHRLWARAQRPTINLLETPHEQGVSMLIIGLLIADGVFCIFYLLDHVNGNLPLIGGIQTFRVVVLVCCTFLIAALTVFRAAAESHYLVIANATIFILLQAAAYVAYTARSHTTYAEMTWALTSSMVTAIIVVFGFARLKAMNVLILTLSGSASAMFYAFVPGGQAQQAGRLITHLTVATLVCYLLRQTIEKRERQLLASARELHERTVRALAAEQADQAKERFLANMSHEVRTPMNAVLQTLEIVGSRASQEDRQLVSIARSSGDALLKILNSILDYSKSSKGEARLTLSTVELGALIDTVRDLYLASASAKGIALKITLNIDERCKTVLTDEVKIVEIISNLVSNAVKFTSSGEIEICLDARPATSKSDRARVKLRVRDTGCGIAEEHRDNVFTPFFRVHDGSDAIVGGTGLGLAIVKDIVKALGGTIQLVPGKPDGTEFIVRLTLKLASNDGAQVRPELPAERHLSRLSKHDTLIWRNSSIQDRGLALLVDDNSVNAIIATRFLEMAGFVVIHAEDGMTAIERFRAGSIDVILMDYRMPRMDGLDATRRIRAHEQDQGVTRPVPIIAVTGNALVGDRERCLEAGMSDYLAKPYGMQELHDKLDVWSPAIWRSTA